MEMTATGDERRIAGVAVAGGDDFVDCIHRLGERQTCVPSRETSRFRRCVDLAEVERPAKTSLKRMQSFAATRLVSCQSQNLMDIAHPELHENHEIAA